MCCVYTLILNIVSSQQPACKMSKIILQFALAGWYESSGLCGTPSP